jgi:hypothetical protein
VMGALDQAHVEQDQTGDGDTGQPQPLGAPRPDHRVPGGVCSRPPGPPASEQHQQ